MDTVQFNKLQRALKLINEANALVQQAMPAGEECYAIHTALMDVDDQICDVIRDADEVGITA